MEDHPTPPVRPDGLQLDEDRGLQEKFWRVERVSWGVFGILIVLASLGFLGGGGPYAHANVQADAYSMTYPRVARWEATDELRFELAPGVDRRRIAVSAEFAEFFQIEDLQPPQVSATTGPEGETFEFISGPGGGQVILHLRVQKPGIARYRVQVDGSQPQRLITVILP